MIDELAAAIFDATAEAHALIRTTGTCVLMRPHASDVSLPGPPTIYVDLHESARLSAVGALYAYNMLNVM